MPPRPGGARGSGRTQVLRFVLVGGSNTVVTSALFVLLQRWLTPSAAYTAVFALGLVYTTAMTARVVFGSRLTVRAAGTFIGWYLVVYGIGLGVVGLVQAMWDPSSVVIAVVTVGVTAPLNFIGGRFVFTGQVPGSSKRPGTAFGDPPSPGPGQEPSTTGFGREVQRAVPSTTS